jgi:hypothetical protein
MLWRHDQRGIRLQRFFYEMRGGEESSPKDIGLSLIAQLASSLIVSALAKARPSAESPSLKGCIGASMGSRDPFRRECPICSPTLKRRSPELRHVVVLDHASARHLSMFSDQRKGCGDSSSSLLQCEHGCLCISAGEIRSWGW